MKRFKVGDRVYFVNSNPDFYSETSYNPEDFMHKVFTIREIDKSDCPYYLKGIKGICFYENELELEEIYESPLYQLMKE